MELDAQFRCFSMTKVFASTVALMLEEKGALDLEAAVGDYLPAFSRTFEVVVPNEEAGGKTVEYQSFLTGETHTFKYDTKPATQTLLLKHCMAESSGIACECATSRD